MGIKEEIKQARAEGFRMGVSAAISILQRRRSDLDMLLLGDGAGCDVEADELTRQIDALRVLRGPDPRAGGG